MVDTVDTGSAAGGATQSPEAIAAAAAAAAAAASQPWYHGADQETVGYLQNRGWDRLQPAEVALKAAQAHREAERMLGVPKDELLRRPKDEASAREFYSKLGVPAVATEYDFSAVKFSDGEALDAEFVSFLQNEALALHVPKADAARFAASLVKRMESQEAAETTVKQGQLALEKSELQKSWANNFDTNLFLARRGVAALGLEPSTVEALESVVGYSKLMEAFRKVGEMNGEAKFITNGASGGPNGPGGVFTREQAIARQRELQNDRAPGGFVEKYLKGDPSAFQEMMSLSRIIAGGQTYDHNRGY